MKKKIIALVLLFMGLFVFTACKNSKSDEKLEKNSEEIQENKNEFSEDEKLEEYMSSMASEDFLQYCADERFSVYYNPEFVEETSMSSSDTMVLKIPDEEVYIKVSAREPKNLSYSKYVKSIKKQYNGITIYEYGDESFTAYLKDDKDGNGVEMYAAYDGGKLYEVIKTYPSKDEKKYMSNDMEFYIWWD